MVLLGSQGEPIGLLLRDPRTDEVYEAPVSLRVHPTTDVTETLQRALTRPPAVRFDPVLCTDPLGPRARPAAHRGPCGRRPEALTVP